MAIITTITKIEENNSKLQLLMLKSQAVQYWLAEFYFGYNVSFAAVINRMKTFF